MKLETEILSKKEIENIKKEIQEKIDHISSYSIKKLNFEKERCEQILNRNIPMCISLHTKNILQSDDKNKILGQLHRLNLECYWKLLNLEYLQEIHKYIEKSNK